MDADVGQHRVMFWAGVFVGFWTAVAWNHWVTLQYSPKPLNGNTRYAELGGEFRKTQWRKDGGP